MQKRFEWIRAKCSGKCWNNKHANTHSDNTRERSKFVSDDSWKNVHESLEILAQIHLGIEMRDLFFVAIEHQRRLLARKEAAPDHALALLTPAGMINIRIHVPVESVLVWQHDIPCCRRLFRHKLDLHKRLRALEPVFPWHDKANWCAILLAQGLAIQTCCEISQLVARFC